MWNQAEDAPHLEVGAQVAEQIRNVFDARVFNKSYFGFFDPYTARHGFSELGKDLAVPVCGSFVLGLIAGVATIGIVSGAISTVISLLD